MNEEQGFHAAMHAEPENTTIPLAYADWLEEQGKPAMADTIRQAIAQGGYRIEGMNAHLRESDAPALFYAHKHPSYKVMMFIRHQDVPGLQFRFTVDHNKEKTPATATADHAQVLHDEGVASGPGATHRYLRQSGIIKDKYGKLQRAGGRQSNTNANVAADSLKPSRTLPVPDVDQPNNFTCGPSAVLSVLKYFSVGPDKLSDVITALGTTRKASTDPSRIVTYLQQLGLSAVGKQKMSLDDLAAAVQAGCPVIVPLKEYAGDRSHKYGHYVVVIGVDNLHVTVQDSSLDNVLSGSGSDAAPGKMLIERAKFNAVWHDKVAGKAYYHYGIVVSRPGVQRLSRIDETNPYGAAYAASERAHTASNNAPGRTFHSINAVRSAAAGLWREAAVDHEKARAFHARESVDNFGDKHHLAAEAYREAAIANALAHIASSTGEQDWRPDSITPEDQMFLRHKLARWTQAYPGLHTATFSTPAAQYNAALQHMPPTGRGNEHFDSAVRHAVSPHGPMLNLDFSQHRPDKATGAYGVTGTGHAAQVFRHAAGLVHEALHEHKPSVLTFAASEPSRQRLYDNLAGKVSLVHPDYTGYAYKSGSGSRYALVHKAAEPHFLAAAEKHGIQPAKLNTVKPTSQARLARPVRLAAIPPPGSTGTVTVRVPTPTPVATAAKRPATPARPQPTFILPG